MHLKRLQTLRKQKAELKSEGDAIFATADKDSGGVPTEAQNKRLNEIEAKTKELDQAEAQTVAAMVRDKAAGAEAFDRADAEAATTASAPIAKKHPKPFKSFGEQLLAIAAAAQGHGVHSGLATIMAATGASEGASQDGGFLVQQDFASEIVKGMMAGGQLLSRVRRIPISSAASGIKIPAIDETSRADGSRWGAVRGYWAAEAAALTGSRPKFRMISMNLNKLTGLFYATDELLADAAALGSLARMGFEQEMTFKAEDAIFRGTGAGQPLGLLNAGCVVSQAKETGQAATTIVSQNIFNMWARLRAANRQNAVWLINQAVEPQLMQMYVAVGTGGIPVYLPANNVAGSPFGTLLGRPVIPVEYCSALGTVGDIVLCDLGEYLLIEKGPAEWAESMHVQFTTGEMTFRMVWRLDGQPTLASAITPFKGANTLSPFVTLATRA